MKPAPFEYHAPRDSDEALAILAEHGDEAKALAGGQSLVPLLNFRLAEPAQIVDLNGIGSLAYVRRTKGSLRIGAMTRQSVLEDSPAANDHWPLLGDALRWVAHPQIRNRGTVGGSAAHADPAAELPIAFAALEARFHARSTRGERTIGCEDFFVTHLTTAMEPDELLTEIELARLAPGTGSAFTEYARRHGDFALGGAAALVTLADDACTQARIALLGAADVPVRAAEAEASLIGGECDEAAAAEAARLAVADIKPTGDIHGGSGYRRDLIEAMVRRAVTSAAARAAGGTGDGG
jgi:CO/xanthine dehydrogenase FAD-binding subunit